MPRLSPGRADLLPLTSSATSLTAGVSWRIDALVGVADLARKHYTVIGNPSAENDLIGIAAWYAERHPTGETRFFRDFDKARDMLAQHPRIGRERYELRDGLRSWPVHPYLVFYIVDDAAHAVVIERVIHGHMDIESDDFEA